MDSLTRFIFQVFLLAFIFSLETIFPLFNQKVGRLKHALTNGILGTMNGVFSSVCYALIIAGLLVFIQEKNIGLFSVISFPFWVELFFGFVLFDLWMYCWHRITHRVPLLWRFHRVHHTDTQMDSTTALRFHLGEIFFSILARIPVFILLGLTLEQIFMYELLLQPVILFQHSNICLPEKYDAILRKLIVTPNMHRVHHSKIKRETDSNYSSIFSFWDRLGRTYRERKNIKEILFGLEYYRETSWQGFGVLMKMPFLK